MAPSRWERNVTPRSSIWRNSDNDITWKPPESVRIGSGQFMGINLLSSGAQELVLGPSVSNVRAIVRKTRNLPTLAVTLSIDIQ